MKINIFSFDKFRDKYPILRDVEDEMYEDHEVGSGVDKDHLIEFAKTILVLSEDEWKILEAD